MPFYLHYVMDQDLSSASSKIAKWTENSNRQTAFLCISFVFKLETVIIHFPAVSLVSDCYFSNAYSGDKAADVISCNPSRELHWLPYYPHLRRRSHSACCKSKLWLKNQWWNSLQTIFMVVFNRFNCLVVSALIATIYAMLIQHLLPWNQKDIK